MYRLHYAPDNASMIVRLTLEELGVPYETVLVDRRADAQNSASYLALNPNGLIPTLETPDGVMFETGAILLWLADRHGALAPVPSVPERAAFLTWHVFVSNTLHPALQGLFYPYKFAGPDVPAQTAFLTQQQANILRYLDTLDARYHPPALCVTDFYIAACLRWLGIYGPSERTWFDLSAYPNLSTRIADLETRDSVRAAITAEGLNAQPFTRPHRPNPPEGSAL